LLPNHQVCGHIAVKNTKIAVKNTKIAVKTPVITGRGITQNGHHKWLMNIWLCSWELSTAKIVQEMDFEIKQ
jgi:hypothetical protein